MQPYCLENLTTFFFPHAFHHSSIEGSTPEKDQKMHHSLESGVDKSSYSLISPDTSSSLLTSDDAELYLQGEIRKREISRSTITKREVIIHLFFFLPCLSFFLAAVIISRGSNKTSTLLLGEDDRCLQRHYSYCRFRPFHIKFRPKVLVSYNLHQKPWSVLSRI